MRSPAHSVGRKLGAVVCLVAALMALPAQAAKPGRPVKGYVDKQTFLDVLPSEDPIRVEVTIPKALIQMLCAGLDEELKSVACGLESIEALIVEIDTPLLDRVTRTINDVDSGLQAKGWERIVLVRERDEQVRILVFNDNEAIHGLVVMVVDSSEMVFVNVAGLIDLAAMQRIAGQWNIPGLDHLEEYENHESSDGSKGDDDDR